MFAVTKQAGECMAMPDVCLTPAPPAPPLPVPYPNIAMPMLGMPQTMKVLVCGAPALTKQSEIPLSNGDQGGLNGGVMSGTMMGALSFVQASLVVQFEGAGAVRLGMPTRQNGGNAVGAVLVPSQAVVMIMS